VRWGEVTRRPRHPPAAQQMQMQVEHGLPAVGVGVHHHAVALLRDPFVARQRAREQQHLAQQPRIPRVVQRGHVLCGDDEDMRRRLRWVSRNASSRPSRFTIVAGISPATILQKRQSVALTRPQRPRESASRTSSPRLRRGRAPSTCRNSPSSRSCSGVSSVGVQTWTRTCSHRGPPRPGAAALAAQPVHRAGLAAALQLEQRRAVGVGISTSAPKAAWLNDTGRS